VAGNYDGGDDAGFGSEFTQSKENDLKPKAGEADIEQKTAEKETKKQRSTAEGNLTLQGENSYEGAEPEAAKELGVSRKTYYQWEQRGLDAMLKALQEKEPGRPQTAPLKKQEKKLQKLLSDQQKELENFRQRENLIIEACNLKVLLEKGELEKK